MPSHHRGGSHFKFQLTLALSPKDGLNSKLPAVCDGTGKPVRLLLTAGPTSDYTGARHLLASLPRTQHLIADRGSQYGAYDYQDQLRQLGMTPP